jgi:uncharacterized damage-inducible protein DinB
MTPEQATFLLNEICIPEITNESKTTRRILEAVPADKGEYKPDERSMSAWTLASHIASAEMFFLGAVIDGKFDRANGAIPESVTTPAQLGAWYEESINEATTKLKNLSAGDLTRNLNFHDVLNFPAVQYIQFMLNHSIHHRGQLSAYLRPMGAKVPRIYGGSADEPIEMPAQKQSA